MVLYNKSTQEYKYWSSLGNYELKFMSSEYLSNLKCTTDMFHTYYPRSTWTTCPGYDCDVSENAAGILGEVRFLAHSPFTVFFSFDGWEKPKHSCTWSPRESKRRSEDAGVAAAKSDSFLYLHFGKEVRNSYCPFRPFLKAVSFHLSHHLCILSCTFSKTSAALTKISQKTQISGETVSQACSPSSNHKFCISIKWINMAWFRTI